METITAKQMFMLFYREIALSRNCNNILVSILIDLYDRYGVPMKEIYELLNEIGEPIPDEFLCDVCEDPVKDAEYTDCDNCRHTIHKYCSTFHKCKEQSLNSIFAFIIMLASTLVMLPVLGICFGITVVYGLVQACISSRFKEERQPLL